MNEAHIRNCAGLFLLGPFLIWYSYRKGPPELARKILFWSGVTVLSTSGLGYLNSRFGSDLGMGNLLEKAPLLKPRESRSKDEGGSRTTPTPPPAPLAPLAPPPPTVSRSNVINIKGVAA